MNRLALFVIVLLVGLTGFAWYQKWAAGASFETREAELMSTRDQLESRVGELEEQGDSLRAEIEIRDRRLEQTRLSTNRLSRKSGLDQRLRTSYSEFARIDWGVIDVYDDQSGRYVEYMAVPLWMSETFILDHQNASQCQGSR